LYAAKALGHAAVDVTLVDRRNFHLFQPLLYQVATGSLSPGEVAAPLRALLRHQRNTRVLLGEAVNVDAAGGRLILADGQLPYDTLVVATGSQNHYFGHEAAWEPIAPGLKSIEDATRVRQKLLYAFEAAEREADPARRKAWLTFVIVGAGPTGVELAGALAEIAHDTLRNDFRSIHPEESQILLLEGAPHVLPVYPASLSEAAERSLLKLGVRSRTGVKVTEISESGVTLVSSKGEEKIEARTVIWAAGVGISSFIGALAQATGAQLDKAGRIRVEPDLTIPGHPEIFVTGDAAYLEWHGAALPGVAPVAMQEGRYAAKAILNRLRGRRVEPFHYFNKGNLAVIGRNAGVADFGFLRFHGWPAWFLWLTVHIMYLAQFRNRVIVFLRWGFQYLTFDRGARLITGAPASENVELAFPPAGVTPPKPTAEPQKPASARS
jgi:NADH dehydrogenase